MGAIFHADDVKIDFGADLVFGGPVFFGGIGVGVVGGTPVSTGDDDSFSGFFLNVVEKIGEDRINGFFTVQDGESVSVTAIAVGARGGFGGIGEVENRGIESASFTAEKIFGDPGKTDLSFPWIGISGGMGGGRNRVKEVALAPIDILPFAVPMADLLFFGLFHAGTAGEHEDY